MLTPGEDWSNAELLYTVTGMEVELAEAADTSSHAADVALVAAMERLAKENERLAVVFESPNTIGASQVAADAGVPVYRFQRAANMYKRVDGGEDASYSDETSAYAPLWISLDGTEESSRDKAGLSGPDDDDDEPALQPRPEGLDLGLYTIGVGEWERKSGMLSEQTCEQTQALVKEHGVALLRGVFEAEQMGSLCAAVDARFAACKERLAEEGVDLSTHFRFNEIVHRASGRYDVKVAAQVEQLLASAPWQSLLRKLLGKDWVPLYQSCIIAQPGAAAQSLHSDNAHLFPGSEHIDNAHCITLIVPLVDVTETNGPTDFWPGSQREEVAQKIMEDAKVHIVPSKPCAAMAGQRGDVVVFDTRTIHRGGANKSGERRPILYLAFARPWYTEGTTNFAAETLFPEEAAAAAAAQ